MHPMEGGRFCDSCQKKVSDFTKVPLTQLNELERSNSEEQCGRFKFYQLHAPFGDWRDKLVARYQQMQLETTFHPFFKYVKLTVLMLVILMSGCARRTAGQSAFDYEYMDHKKQESKKNTSQTQTSTKE